MNKSRNRWKKTLFVFLVVGMMVWFPTISYACSPRNVSGCLDQMMYDTLRLVAELLWLGIRGILLSAHLVEISREWIVQDVARPQIDNLQAWVSNPFMIIFAGVAIMTLIAYVLRPIIATDIVSLRKTFTHLPLVVLVFWIGGNGVVWADALMIGGGAYVRDGLYRGIAVSPPIVARVTAPPSSVFAVADIVPIYTDEARCPRGTLLPEEVDEQVRETFGPTLPITATTQGWSLKRSDPTQITMIDVTAAFVFADAMDIHCPDRAGQRPALPLSFSGTASVVPDRPFFAFPESDGGEFSIIGPPTLTVATMQRIICREEPPSPLCLNPEEVEQIYYRLLDFQIDPAFWMAMVKQESSYGGSQLGRTFNNIHAVRCNNWDNAIGCETYIRPNGENIGGFSRYASRADSVEAWALLMTSRGIYADAGNVTPRQIVFVYAPPSDGNDTEAYVSRMEQRMTAWRAEETGDPQAPASLPPPTTPNTPVTATTTITNFVGYFSHAEISSLQTQRRTRLTMEAGSGLFRLILAYPLAIAAFLEALTHFLLSLALVISWFALTLGVFGILFVSLPSLWYTPLESIHVTIRQGAIIIVGYSLLQWLMLDVARSQNPFAVAALGMVMCFAMGVGVTKAGGVCLQAILSSAPFQSVVPRMTESVGETMNLITEHPAWDAPALPPSSSPRPALPDTQEPERTPV